MTAKLRPETDVPGLYMTGQDAMMCGFTGALFGGVLCASQVLRRNVLGDIEKLQKALCHTWWKNRYAQFIGGEQRDHENSQPTR